MIINIHNSYVFKNNDIRSEIDKYYIINIISDKMEGKDNKM